MKTETPRIINDSVPCYGTCAEQWKYDDYTRRKNWWKRNRTKMIAFAAVCCVLVTIALFLLVK